MYLVTVADNIVRHCRVCHANRRVYVEVVTVPFAGSPNRQYAITACTVCSCILEQREYDVKVRDGRHLLSC